MADDLQSKAADVMKRVLTVGVGTLFLTEEALRGLVSEFKLPKELLGGILDSASKTKDDFLRNLSQEVMAKIGDRIDPRALVEEFLETHDVEFSVKMSFKRREK